MTRASIYHIALLLLTVFSSTVSLPAHAEDQRLLDVWPVGMKQQYLYYTQDGDVIGEQWMELRQIPRAKPPRYEIVNTIDVDGVPHDHTWKQWGRSVYEVDEWGRPVAYEAEVFGPTEDSVRRVRAEVNYPQVDIFVSVNDGEEQSYSQPITKDSRLVDFIFIGPYDLAMRLQPFTPQRQMIVRDWIIPNMKFAMSAELELVTEEVITTPDGTEYPTARLNSLALLLDLWYAPGGKLVKAEIAHPYTIVWAGETVMPDEAAESSTP